MATLSDREILSMTTRGELISENFFEASLTPNGYDLRVQDIRVDGTETGDAVIKPGSHFLASTLEYMALPDDVIGQIWIRSSFARRGIIGSFGAVDAGYHGTLTLSFLNAGETSLELKTGERVAQIVFHRLESVPHKAYGERSGNYQNSRGVTVKGRS